MYYILAKQSPALVSYLAGGAKVAEQVGGCALISIPTCPGAHAPDHNARWLRSRLASGLQLVSREIFSSLILAREEAERACPC